MHFELVYNHMILVFLCAACCFVLAITLLVLIKKRNNDVTVIKIFIFSPENLISKININYILIKFIIKIMFIELMNVRTRFFFLYNKKMDLNFTS